MIYKIKKLSGFVILTLLLSAFVLTPVAYAGHCGGVSSPSAADNCAAQDARGGTGLGGTTSNGDTADKTSYSFNGKKTDVGINDLVIEILKFLSITVGIAVVAGITIGGITYSTSQGNPSQAQKGVTIISNAVLGLVLYFLMFAIVNFLIPGGILR